MGKFCSGFVLGIGVVVSVEIAEIKQLSRKIAAGVNGVGGSVASRLVASLSS